MGDYRQHQVETGMGLCNSFEDVKRIKVIFLIKYIFRESKVMIHSKIKWH